MSNCNGHRWSKFWWRDHQGDAALWACSLAARGYWMELLCVAHEATPIGHVLLNGRAPTYRQKAAIAGCTEKEAQRLEVELEEAGVFSRTDDGTIYSRRMVKDAAQSQAGAEAVKKRWDAARPNTPPNRVANGEAHRGATPTPTTKKLEVESEKEETPVGVSPRVRAKTPKQILPENWEPGPKEVQLGHQLGLSAAEIARETERMRDWAAAKAAAYADWHAFFRNWLRDAVNRQRQEKTQPVTTDELRSQWGLPTFLGPNGRLLS